MRRLLATAVAVGPRCLAVAAVAGLLATTAPAATACGLEHCPGTSLVCGPVVDCTPELVGCVPVGDWAYICL